LLQSLTWVVGLTALVMITPGADMVLVARNTIAGSRRDGWLTSCGVLTGNLVHITACALGVGWMLANSPLAYSVLRGAAATYLIGLGVVGLLAGRAERDPVDGPRRPLAPTPFLQGLLNNLLNPKGALFYLSVFAQLTRPGVDAAQRLVAIAAMVVTSATFWLLFVQTLHLPAPRAVFARSRGTVQSLLAIVLIALGVWILTGR
jgi:threonine/homoserine/homoserine lactone efflux protein